MLLLKTRGLFCLQPWPLGVQYKSLGLNAMHATNTYDLRGQEQSNFEIGLQYSFWKQQD